MSLLDTASLVITPNGTKASKLYSVVPSDGAGDMTVTRATTATRVNSAGLIESVASNVPRLDYSNGTCPSILVEPQRTNIFTYSEDFTNANWSKNLATVTANATTSPSGTTTADKLIIDSGSQDNPVVYIISDTTANTRTLSFFAKASEYNIAFARVGGDLNAPIVLFSLTGSGSILHNQNATSYSIESVGNGWYRCTMTYAHGVSFVPNIGVCSATYSVSATLVNSTGNGTSGIFIWGAQLEAGSYATSYIPTTSASVTRNADVISKTGISSLIGQTEGTMFIDFVCNGFDNFGSPLSINDGTTDNAIWINTFEDGTIRVVVFDNSSVQVGISMYSGVVGQRYKIAFVYKLNDFAMYVNGTLIGSDSSGTIPLNLSRVDFNFTNTTSFTKSLLMTNTVALWKTRLTNTQLAQLTTI